jgi:glycosyltransferase involved in cell wall biosynthesis
LAIVKIVALIEVFNEERYLPTCLRFLSEHGVGTYIVDNGSTDRTLEIASSELGGCVLGIEESRRYGVFSLYPQLQRKERLAATLDADWFVHMDADEIRLPPPRYRTLQDALVAVDAAGFNAVSFLEFTFVPTLEHPDHDHSDYVATMRWYYPFRPRVTHRLNAWKRQPAPVELAAFGGHEVRFPGRRVSPVRFPMKHYPYLSRAHAIQKYVQRQVDQTERARWGWHKWRGLLEPSAISLLSEQELHQFVSDDELDDSNPRLRHHFATEWHRSRQRS